MTAPAAPESFEWDEEVTVLVTVRVKAKPNPEFFEGLDVPGANQPIFTRTPLSCAIAAVASGRSDLEYLDGYADMIGSADITYVEEGY